MTKREYAARKAPRRWIVQLTPIAVAVPEADHYNYGPYRQPEAEALARRINRVADDGQVDSLSGYLASAIPLQAFDEDELKEAA